MQVSAPTMTVARPAPLHSSAVATAAVGCAFLLAKLALSFNISTPFHFFYGAVAVSAWYSGVRGGALASVLAVIISDVFLIEPINAVSYDAGTIFRVITFLVTAGLVTALSEARLRDRNAAMEARERAEEAVRARGAFLSVAAHELKTPLTALQLQVQLMERRAAREQTQSERGQRALDVIINQVRRLDRLIGSLLDISRIEHGQLTLRKDRLNLTSLTRRAIDEIQPISEVHPISLTQTGELPTVIGDELRLEQVLQNLLHNAIKYSPAGGPIAVCLDTDDGRVQIAVTDRGIGIPPEAIPQLFTQFYRATNASPEHISGMGIGLYVVREIVRLHGGEVTVESIEGQGCTFAVELPRA